MLTNQSREQTINVSGETEDVNLRKEMFCIFLGGPEDRNVLYLLVWSERQKCSCLVTANAVLAVLNQIVLFLFKTNLSPGRLILTV